MPAPAFCRSEGMGSVFFRNARFLLPLLSAERLYFAEKLWYPESNAPGAKAGGSKNSHAGGIS